jgi:transposase InsO family protein
MDARMSFLVQVNESDESFSALCRRFGISRKTGYKWCGRYEAYGPSGLEDRSPVAVHSPHAVAAEQVDIIVGLRKEHPFWGPKKLLGWLKDHRSDKSWPAASTMGDVLKRNGLIRPRRRRVRAPMSMDPLAPTHQANDTWCVDFKGHFALGDKSRCHPLTVTDQYSRYLLKCEALTEPTLPPVKHHFELAFREYGMPERIRSDNGPPFATVGLGGLSDLSIWWIKLGILPERIEPGQPQQNGRHERMHKTLKQEATQPPGASLAEQQRIFDRFRRGYNDERPHEALGQKPPSSRYCTSPRAFPDKPRSPEYPESSHVRRLDDHGRLHWHGKHLVARCLAGEPVGIEPVDEDTWELRYGSVLLAELVVKNKQLRLERVG